MSLWCKELQHCLLARRCLISCTLLHNPNHVCGRVLQVVRVLGRDESQLDSAEPPAALHAPLPSPAARASSSGLSPSHSQHGGTPTGQAAPQAVEADQVANMLDAHMAVEQINTPQARWVGRHIETVGWLCCSCGSGANLAGCSCDVSSAHDACSNTAVDLRVGMIAVGMLFLGEHCAVPLHILSFD